MAACVVAIVWRAVLWGAPGVAGFAHRVLGGSAQKRLRRTRTIAPSTTPARRASVRACSLEAACFAAILRALASSFFTVFRWFLEERTATGWTPTASNAICVAFWKAGCTEGGSSRGLGLDRGGVGWRSVLGSGGVRPRSPPAPHLSRGPGPTDIDRCERIEPGPDIRNAGQWPAASLSKTCLRAFGIMGTELASQRTRSELGKLVVSIGLRASSS